MEEGKRMIDSSAAKVAAYHSEVRLESSPSAIGFSDSCPCCGNKKRRCLQPASSFRKKLLVLDSSDPDPDTSDHLPTASLSLTPPPPPFREIYADPISPMSPPLPPTTPILDRRHPPADTPSASLDEALERSNSTLTEEKGVICAAKKEKKARLKNGEDAASPEEVRVCVRCSCGVVRRILLVR